MKKHFKALLILVFALVAIITAAPSACAESGPVSVTSVTQKSSNSVLIEWESNEQFEGYEVFRAFENGQPKYIKTTDDSFTYNYNLTVGSKYSYFVRGFSTENGEKVYSELSEGVEVLVGARTPEMISAEALSASSVYLSWSGDAADSGYYLYRSEDGENWSLVKRVNDTGAATYGLAANVQYYFRVKAIRDADGKVFSGDNSRALAYYNGITAPENLSAELYNGTTAHIKWTSVQGADEYRLYRSVNGGSFQLVKTVYGTETFNYSLSSDNSYDYCVTAVQRAASFTRTSGYSVPAHLMNGLGQTSVSSIERASTDGAEILWNETEGANAYRLYRKNSAGTMQLIKTVNGLSTKTYGLTAGNVYSFAIKPIYEGTYRTVSGEISEEYAYYHAGPITVYPALYTDSGILLRWSSVSGADGYRVYKNTADSCEETAYVSECRIELPQPDESCSFFVRAEKNGALSGRSSAVIVERQMRFAVSQYVDGFVQLAWAPEDNARCYEIERRVSGGEFEKLAETEECVFQDRSVEYGTAYEYRYRAMLDSGFGIWSQPANVEIPAAPVYRALLIGEENYSEVLQGPINDIGRMQTMLSGTSQDWTIYKQADATKNEVIALVNLAFGDATENDVSLFYYSGHGAMYSGDYYSGALLTVEYNYFPTSELASMLSTVKGKVIVILDSCGSGATIMNNPTTVQLMNETDDVFSPADFTSAVINDFASYGVNDMEKSGELRREKFYVLVSSAYEQTSHTIMHNNLWGGVFTRALTGSIGMNYETMNWRSNMPADTDGDGAVSLCEAYIYTATASAEYQDVQAYPANSGMKLFIR